MNKFIPQLENINPRWINKWGETFGSPDLANQMKANNKIADRLRDRMLLAFGINMNAEMAQEDIWAATAYGENKDRLALICGMVIHGEYLRTCVSKEQFDAISSVFSIEDLKIAVSLHHLHPEQSEFTADPSKIATLIERSGNACIHAWKASLSEEIGMRVYLMESDDELEDEGSNTIDARTANQIITAVSIALNNEKNDPSLIAA